jgi:hypothetical protein
VDFHRGVLLNRVVWNFSTCPPATQPERTEQLRVAFKPG